MELLENTDMSIAEIAVLTGFTGGSYYAEIFESIMHARHLNTEQKSERISNKTVCILCRRFKLYKIISSHSFSLKPIRTLSSHTRIGRFTSIPSVESNCSCSSSTFQVALPQDSWTCKSFRLY